MDSTATFLASPVLFMGICALQGLRCSQSSVTSPVHYRAFVPACGSQVSLLKIYALRCSQLEVQRPHKTNIHEILECPSTIARRWANSKNLRSPQLAARAGWPFHVQAPVRIGCRREGLGFIGLSISSCQCLCCSCFAGATFFLQPSEWLCLAVQRTMPTAAIRPSRKMASSLNAIRGNRSWLYKTQKVSASLLQVASASVQP